LLATSARDAMGKAKVGARQRGLIYKPVHA
jgi:hypothetical protein